MWHDCLRGNWVSVDGWQLALSLAQLQLWGALDDGVVLSGTTPWTQVNSTPTSQTSLSVSYDR